MANIQAVGCLLEVDMSDAVCANVMIIDKSEFSVRGHALYQRGSGLYIGVTLEHRYLRVCLCGGLAVVLGVLCDSVGIQVHSTSTDAWLSNRSWVSRGDPKETEEDE